MLKLNYLKWSLRITALFLWYFTPVYIFTVLGLITNVSIFSYSFVRQPYQWDFELMFAVLFLVWGIFLWMASNKSAENILFIRFTAWSLMTHVAVMVSLGLSREGELVHFFVDSIPYLILGIVLIIGVANKKHQ